MPRTTAPCLTLPEVADLLQVSARTAYRLAQRHELPGFKAGGSWRFRRSDIDAWISSKVKSISPLGPTRVKRRLDQQLPSSQLLPRRHP